MTDWHASDYYRQSALQQAMAAELLGQLALEGTERILDVGCGDGKISAEIAARVPAGSVLGVDPSQDMIAFASSHFGPPVLANSLLKKGDRHVATRQFSESFDASLGASPLFQQAANLRFEVADVCHLSFREEFDLVVSFNALHWVAEQGAALHSIHTALKPGGQALLRFVPNGPRKSLEDVIEDVRNESRWADHFHDFRRPYVHFTVEEYRDLAERAGFRILQLRVLDKAWDFKTREAFVAFGRATFVEWTRCLPESEREAFISETLDRYETVAADSSQEVNTFKFYQMEVRLGLFI